LYCTLKSFCETLLTAGRSARRKGAISDHLFGMENLVNFTL
jgi:hypothetical protein